MNAEELKDIIECIIKFDSTTTDMQKARYFDVIHKDLKRVVKLLATPDVSGSLPSTSKIEETARRFSDKRYYTERTPYDTTVTDFKAGVEWLLGYMASNDR